MQRYVDKKSREETSRKTATDYKYNCDRRPSHTLLPESTQDRATAEATLVSVQVASEGIRY